jgi:hypothetical protein
MEIARRETKSAGQVVSTLAVTAPHGARAAHEPRAAYRFRPFAARSAIATNELIDSLRDGNAY